MQVLHWCVSGRLAMARLCPDAFPGTRRWQNAREIRSPASDGGNILARCVPGRFAVARFRRDAFPGGNPWQFFHSMYPKRGLGRENRQFVARFTRHASENGLALAGYARHASEKPRKPPLEDTPREYLAIVRRMRGKDRAENAYVL